MLVIEHKSSMVFSCENLSYYDKQTTDKKTLENILYHSAIVNNHH